MRGIGFRTPLFYVQNRFWSLRSRGRRSSVRVGVFPTGSIGRTEDSGSESKPARAPIAERLSPCGACSYGSPKGTPKSLPEFNFTVRVPPNEIPTSNRNFAGGAPRRSRYRLVRVSSSVPGVAVMNVRFRTRLAEGQRRRAKMGVGFVPWRMEDLTGATRIRLCALDE